MYRQVELRSGDSRLICWLEYSEKWKAGSVISLKEIPNIQWTVQVVYYMQVSTPPERRWRVGGLQ